MKRIFLLFTLIACILPNQIVHSTALQSASIQVSNNQATVDFPRYIHFKISIQGTADINQVTLVYGTNARTCLSAEARQPVKVDSAKSVSATWEWDLNRAGALPPGAEVWWRWEITDTQGSKLSTDKSIVTLEDTSFDWQSAKSGAISVFWVKGDSAFGNMLLNKAVTSVDQFVKNAGLSKPNAISVYVYPTFDDLKAATLHEPDWIGGLAYPEYDTTIMAIDPNDTEWADHVIPHELSHLVTAWRVFNCSGGYMPTWLDEGLARFAEGQIPVDELAALKKAIDT